MGKLSKKQLGSCDSLAEGYAVHLAELGAPGPGSRPAQGNARMVIPRSSVVTGQYWSSLSLSPSLTALGHSLRRCSAMSKWHYLGVATKIQKLGVTFEEGSLTSLAWKSLIQNTQSDVITCHCSGGGSGSILRQNSLRVNYNKYHSAPSSAPARSHSSEKYER